MNHRREGGMNVIVLAQGSRLTSFVCFSAILFQDPSGICVFYEQKKQAISLA